MCEKGKYQPNTGRTSCIECPLGYYQLATGSNECDAHAEKRAQFRTSHPKVARKASSLLQPSQLVLVARWVTFKLILALHFAIRVLQEGFALAMTILESDAVLAIISL